MAEQVKSRRRIADHGEVFTNEREVNAMLDMVKQEAGRIDSRFFEPACGNGNFLAEVLRRKLEVVRSRYGKSTSEYEKYVFVAVGSIYGVELLEDNVKECRDRLFGIVEESHKRVSNGKGNPKFLIVVRFVLERNILCGNALDLKDNYDKPIVFSEWSMVVGNKVKRRDFRLDEILEGNVRHGETMSLFGSSGLPTTEWEYDEETETYIPAPIQEYPLVDYCEVSAHG